ncbi:MAG: hypothetical protein GY862_34380 [Gammaproteobacteria bacterium]|nr:hypothetical protein [Gammaproteobacteria bacterium]
MLRISDIKEFFSRLEDKPLEPENSYYEPYLKDSPEDSDSPGDPIKRLGRRIIWSNSVSVNLLSGQRGSGKSTELRRLRKLLEEEACVVFLCDMQGYINLNFPIEITDFLLSVMLAFSESVGEKYQKDFVKENIGERFWNFLTNTNINLNELNLASKGKIVSVKAALQQDPTFKRRLQEKLRGHVTGIVEQTNDFCNELTAFIKKKEGDDKKIVLLVDSVEQIIGIGDNATEVHQSVENLFGHHSEKLYLNGIDVLYTVPPYLPPLVPGLGRNLGGGMIEYIPSIHVFKRGGDPDANGLAVMRKIINRRFHEWQQIFSPEQLNEIALSTGGDLRDFFRLIKGILLRTETVEQLPVRANILKKAKAHMRAEMLPIPKDDMQWLKKINDSKKPELETVRELPRLARFFDTNLVQNYRNGDDWYDIHPLLKNVIN